MDVVVPWERVFVYKSDLACGHHLYSYLRAVFHHTASDSKLEAFLGVAQLLSQYGRRDKSASSQILLSNLMQDIEILRCCIQVVESRGYMSLAAHMGTTVKRGLSGP